MHTILCDEINSGKSAFCLELAKRLINSGLSVGGWITPPNIVDGEKCGHDFILIDDNRFNERLPFTRLEPFTNSFKWRRYYFNNEVFEHAKHCTSEVGSQISEVRNQTSDIRLQTSTLELFIMDEIGPMELDDGMGFIEAFEKAVKSHPLTLTVLRKGLMNQMSVRYRDIQFETYGLNETDALENTLRRIAAAERLAFW